MLSIVLEVVERRCDTAVLYGDIELMIFLCCKLRVLTGDRAVRRESVMGKTAGRPRGRMTAYAFFVQTCREEFRKKHPDERVVFAEFSKKCAQRWKVCGYLCAW